MEEQNKKRKLFNIILTFSKQHKTLIVLVAVVLIIYLTIVVLNKNKKEETPSLTPTPTATLITPTPGASYFLNQIMNSKPPVSGTTWVGDDLYYSNNTGFFNASSNNVINKDVVTFVSLSENGKTIYFNSKEWWFYDIATKNERLLTGEFAYPKLSPDGAYFVDCRGSFVYIYNTNDFNVIEKNIGTNLTKCDWAKSSNNIAVMIVRENNFAVKIYNNKLEEQGSFESEVPIDLVSVSPNAEDLLVEQSGALNLVGSSGTITTIYSNPKSKYTSNWIDDKNVVIIETRFDNKGKQTDFFWKYKISGKMEYLTNSMPITGKVNTNVFPSLNQRKNTIALSENGGRIWLLSLDPGKMAFYSDKGLTFLEMSSAGGE